MKQEKVYIKGAFKGKYIGPLDKANFTNKNFYNIQFYDLEIEDAIVIPPYKKKYLTYDPYLEYNIQNNVKIHLKGNESTNVFVEDLHDIIINDVKLLHLTKSEGKSFGHIEGHIYGTYIYEKPEKSILKDEKIINSQDTRQIIEKNQPETIVNEIIEEPEEIIFGQEKSVWDQRFSEIKNGSFKLLGILTLGLFITSYLGVNLLSISLLTFILIYFLNSVLAPVLGWNNIPSSQKPSMVGSTRGFIRKSLSFFLLAFFVISLILKWNYFGWFLLALWIIQLFSYSSVGVYKTRRIWQILSSFLILGALLALLTFISNQGGFIPKDDNTEPIVVDDKENESTIDTIGNQIKMNYSRVWYDYNKNKYSGDFQSLKNNFKKSRINRVSINNPRGFQEIYNRLWVNDTKLLPSMINMLDSIRIARKLNKDQFADMAVSFVQYIPYVLVHDESCASLVSQSPNDDFIQTYHREGKECLPIIKFGVQAPAEFGYNLKGDCDTRVVLLFTLLDHFGYDVAILISEAYGHCVLGINKPGTGSYKNYYGTKYFVWETTSKGFRMGQFPAEVSNMNNWHIALTSKNN